MEEFLIIAITLFFIAAIGWLAYFRLKKKYERGEEIWNGRWLFSDTRIVKESDVKLGLFSAVVITLLFVGFLVGGIALSIQ